jgi:hypothetical protein
MCDALEQASERERACLAKYVLHFASWYKLILLTRIPFSSTREGISKAGCFLKFRYVANYLLEPLKSFSSKFSLLCRTPRKSERGRSDFTLTGRTCKYCSEIIRVCVVHFSGTPYGVEDHFVARLSPPVLDARPISLKVCKSIHIGYGNIITWLNEYRLGLDW